MEGAAPGDTLAVEILELTTRVPYGINATSSTTGVFAPTYGAAPGDPVPDIPRGTIHLIRTGMAHGRAVAFFSDTIQVPMSPFMGTMAVAPENPTVGQPGVRTAGLQTSGPPGPYGGNMDFRDLKVGTTLYLPVFHPGALFYVGDPHGVQGDGEVSGNALEQSLSGVFRFTILKGKTHFRTTRRNGDAVFHDGHRHRFGSGDAEGGIGNRRLSCQGERTHARQGAVALQHRHRFPLLLSYGANPQIRPGTTRRC